MTTRTVATALFLLVLAAVALDCPSCQAWRFVAPFPRTETRLCFFAADPCRRVSIPVTTRRRVHGDLSLLPVYAKEPDTDQEQYEEEECPNEEECEIDWDKMPGFEEDDDDDETVEVPPLPTTTTEENALPQAEEEEEGGGGEGPILYNDFENDLMLLPPEEDEELLTSFTSFTPTTVLRAEQEQQPEKKEKLAKKEATLTTAAAAGQYQRGRTNLEMTWQMQEASQECDVDVPETCHAVICGACQGRGRVPCRFCHGTRQIKLEGMTTTVSFPCRICSSPSLLLLSSSKTKQQNSRRNHNLGTEVCHACQGSGYIAAWTQLATHSIIHPPSQEKDKNQQDNKKNRLLP